MCRQHRELGFLSLTRRLQTLPPPHHRTTHPPPSPSFSGSSRPADTDSISSSWDDWVPQDRLRKLTDDNRELAANLRRELTASAPKVVPKSAAKTRRGQGSEIGSGRGSEERLSSVPAAGGRGSKRARDNEIEKVGGPIHPQLIPCKAFPCSPLPPFGFWHC